MTNKFFLLFLVMSAAHLFPQDQSSVGAGNVAAQVIGSQSPLVQSSKQILLTNARDILDTRTREATIDAFNNPGTCIAHRAGLSEADKTAIVQSLITAGLVNPADGAVIPGGLRYGIFPPALNEGSGCVQLPLSFDAAPGSSFGGHHSYPGGLAVHEALNDQSDINFAATYRGMYGNTGRDGLPIARGATRIADVYINQDVIIAAPIWHDWAKPLVFQWNADGSEFQELNFGGAGTLDNFGQPGDSRTGGHHIVGIAETMSRGLSPELVIAQASAHSAPTLGNEYKVVNWLRAAAIISRIDPVARGYLVSDSAGRLRLPPLRQLAAGVNLLEASQTNLLVEFQLHNLSDADFVCSIPAVTQSQAYLQAAAARFGFNPADTVTYNNRFRNPVLAYLGPERLLIIYGNQGLEGVVAEIAKLRARGLI